MSKRSDRIREHIPMERLLSDYGYDVRELEREQQFKCDLHGDGSDNAPSARVYPTTQTWYCFACGQARNVISTVMEKEGVEYAQACRLLEAKYGLTPWNEYEEKDPFKESEDSSEFSDLESIRNVTVRRLERATKERVVGYADALKLWEAINLVSCLEKQTVTMWKKIHDKIVLAEDAYDGRGVS